MLISPESTQNLPAWQYAAFAAFFVALWAAMSFYFAGASDWRLLARKFSAQGTPDGERFRNQVYAFGSIYERGATVITVSPEGLHLRATLLFRLGHPPLLIPWRSIRRVVHGKSWWRNWYSLNVEDTTLIRVGSRAFEAMARYLPAPVDAAA